ncbi:flavin reductase family protein [Flavobacterium sp. 7A]|uniref:flavin reductase family protein n=1 Tax=Flavobacterium sp. 7A TaxID=2940571 RepID=UPI002226EADB|nr:flavin reductase [Flavobacterium sp. 7A]MCW2120798.1 flavin reductase (DIM6/NTAB) family NADH-FMN oxidoreductase RutF [Flavobacterium sp. 7A]
MSQKSISATQIESMDSRQRVNLINAIVGFKCVNLIGTVNSKGSENLAIFSSIIHLGSSPALLGFITRPDSVERHTLTNLLETGCYTINHINSDIFEKAHQTSARYDADVSEFDATNLTAEYKEDFTAPFVKQSNIQIGMKFKQKIDIELNGTILVIGEIDSIHYPEDCLCTDGFIDIEKADTVTCSGLDSYHSTQRLSRLAYAKPDRPTVAVNMKYVE